MNYAIIENGIVTNVIVLDNPDLADTFHAVPLEDGYGMGDFYDGTTWTKAPQPEPPTPSIDEVKTSKLAEVNTACQNTIFAGVDVTTTVGTEHFSLTENDQINLSSVYQQIQAGAAHAPYHADDTLCRQFTADEIKLIMTTASAFKTYHTTYTNHLRTWVKRCETVSDVQAITYGTELPADLLEHLNEILGVTANETTA